MEVELIFPSAIARANFPQFIKPAFDVIQERMAQQTPNVWNVCQSDEMFDPRLDGLLEQIAQRSFSMLSEQGYDMTNVQTRVSEFWGKEFRKTGQHIEHVHANNAQISGFYFIEVPRNSSMPIIFDPRQGKRQINMRQANMDEMTYASEQFYMQVAAGDLILTNSWLPHGVYTA
jgi:uncharacterized protein (TIGR02466 family)